MLRRHTFSVGPFQANCTVLIDDATKEAAVIDAGADFERIRTICEREGAVVRYALNTHAHLDHIGAVAELKRWVPGARIALHPNDEALYLNLPMQGRMFGFDYAVPPRVDQLLHDGEELRVGEAAFSVLHTPGHSPGGVCFLFKEGVVGEPPVLFTGDTLFQLSIGRSDLWGGDHRELLASIRNRLFILDERTVVLPGHGPSTSIGVEKRENPFL